ncbi:tripartite tricarboxylate transporter substrate binding protein [Variovorax defluvii]|uniref:Tripartite tricarboxylate transporter substrate binding protein n=1 Tax=Variovorax defluvii TaxID=913761 RepID=A0ABP8HXW0_9BURK
MNFSRTRRALVLGGAAAAVARPSLAQPFPSRPIRMLVGFAAGGGADTIARLYAHKMQEVLGQSVIVDNRPGASQLLAIRPMMSSPPDGYTVTLATGSGLTQGPGVRKDLPYDPLKDFSLIGMVATAPGVFFVNPSLPIKSMRELIAYVKVNPGKLNYGSAGVGAANHLQMEYVKQVTKTNMEHIPYKSDQDVTREVAAGSVHVGLTIAQFAIPLVAAGKLRGLAVTGASRLSALPDVPSIAESGVAELKSIDNYTFYGLVGPSGMPAPVIERLNEAINKASSAPDVVSRMREQLFYNPSTGTPAALRQYLEAELPKWRELGKSIKLEGTS